MSVLKHETWHCMLQLQCHLVSAFDAPECFSNSVRLYAGLYQDYTPVTGSPYNLSSQMVASSKSMQGTFPALPRCARANARLVIAPSTSTRCVEFCSDHAVLAQACVLAQVIDQISMLLIGCGVSSAETVSCDKDQDCTRMNDTPCIVINLRPTLLLLLYGQHLR